MRIRVIQHIRFLIVFLIVFPIISTFAFSQENSTGNKDQNKLLNSTEKDTIKFKLFEIEGVSDEYKRRIIEGIKLSYANSPDFEVPFSMFDSLTAMRPDRPEGFFLKSALYFSLYSANPRSVHFDSLKYFSDKAIELTKKLMEDDPDNKYYKLYLGAAYGNMGLYYLNNGSYWKAYRNGKKGKNYLEDALKTDPDFGDAQFGIGIFYYYTDVLSKYIKPLLYIIGMSGDRKKGLSMLEASLKNSTLAQVESRDYLARFYSRYEGRRDKAEQYLLFLHETFPDNPFYLFNLSVFYYDYGDYIRSAELFSKVEKETDLKYKFYHRGVSFYLGLIYHKLGDYNISNTYLDRVVNRYGMSSEILRRNTYFFIGKNLECLGKRNQALSYYKKAEDVDIDSHKYEIEYYLENALSEGDFKLIETDKLINNRKYDKAIANAKSNLSELLNTSNGKSERIANLFRLRITEANLKLDNIEQAKKEFVQINVREIDENKVDIARYFTAGAEIYLALDKKEKAWEYLDEVYGMERNSLPVYFVRQALYLQRKILGEIKKR